jgi:hypothetical protein
MSYFPDGVIFVIVPTDDVTEEMVNNSKRSFYVTGSASENSFRKSVDGTSTLIKVRAPASAVFDGYSWYNSIDIKNVVTGQEWDNGE